MPRSTRSGACLSGHCTFVPSHPRCQAGAEDVTSAGRVYERRFILHEPVIEEHAAAEYDGKGWLTVVLRKRSATLGE